MKKRFLLLASLMLLSSCQQEQKVYKEYCPNFGFLNQSYSSYYPCEIDEDNNITIVSKIISPFNTFFEYTNHIYENELNEIKSIINLSNNYVIHLSMCFDRHNLYVNNKNELLKNLAYLNMNYGSSTFIELEQETYDLLKIAYDLTLLTDGRFNMCIGDLSTLWDNYIKDTQGLYTFPSEEEVNKALSNVPSVEQIKEIFVFDDETHSVKFNRIENKNISVTFGGVAKGRATDLLKYYFEGKRTLISAGQSSISAYGDSFSDSWKLGIINPLYSFEKDAYLLLKKQGAFSFSTSGDYQNCKIYQGNRYHHIINPFTGYPSTSFRSISLLGDSGAYLDALTTSLMICTTVEEGNKLLEKVKQATNQTYYPIYMNEEYEELFAYAPSSLKDNLSITEDSKMKLTLF